MDRLDFNRLGRVGLLSHMGGAILMRCFTEVILQLAVDAGYSMRPRIAARGAAQLKGAR